MGASRIWVISSGGPRGDNRQMRRFLKIVCWFSGTVFVIFVVLLLALFVDWDVSASRTERDRTVVQKPSPDGKLVAEIHTSQLLCGAARTRFTFRFGTALMPSARRFMSKFMNAIT
jgi:hypothetical protein